MVGAPDFIPLLVRNVDGVMIAKKAPLGGRAWLDPGLACRRGEEPQSHGSNPGYQGYSTSAGYALFRNHFLGPEINVCSSPKAVIGSIGYHFPGLLVK